MMIGQRTNLLVTDRVDFEHPNWNKDLREQARQYGTLETKAGTDYFVFTRHLFMEIPPFAVGRMVWDNWFVYRARVSRALVIDATEVATVVHQKHEYAHGREAEDIWKGPEAKKNQELLGGSDYLFDIREATRRLTARGLQRQKWTRLLLMQRLARFPESRPSLGSWLKPARSFYRYVYRLHSGKE